MSDLTQPDGGSADEQRGIHAPLETPTEAPMEAPMEAMTTELLPDDETRSRKKRQSGTRQLVEWIVLIFAALFIAVVIKTFLFQAFYIPSESMEPTLHGCQNCNNNDRILVNKLSYKVHDVHRGDIIVFNAPPGEQDGNVKQLVKRVVGLPGEKLEGRDGYIYINGHKLDEPYVNPKCTTPQDPGPLSGHGLDTQTVKPGYYFVMGDNRCFSRDSRYFGQIAGSLIVGRAFVRIWPPSRFGFL